MRWLHSLLRKPAPCEHLQQRFRTLCITLVAAAILGIPSLPLPLLIVLVSGPRLLIQRKRGIARTALYTCPSIYF